MPHVCLEYLGRAWGYCGEPVFDETATDGYGWYCPKHWAERCAVGVRR